MWIELHDTVRDHPKILKLARRLGVPLVQAIGHMTSLWCWTLRMAPDGALDSFDGEDIALAAMWERGHEEFLAAAVAVRLIDETPHGYAMHDWMDYAGSLKSAKRSHDYRVRKRGSEPIKHSAPVASRDADVTVTDSTVISRRPTDQTDRPDQTERPNKAALSLGEDLFSDRTDLGNHLRGEGFKTPLGADDLLAPLLPVSVAHVRTAVADLDAKGIERTSRGAVKYLTRILEDLRAGSHWTQRQPQGRKAPPDPPKPPPKSPEHTRLDELGVMWGLGRPLIEEAQAVLASCPPWEPLTALMSQPEASWQTVIAGLKTITEVRP